MGGREGTRARQDPPSTVLGAAGTEAAEAAAEAGAGEEEERRLSRPHEDHLTAGRGLLGWVELPGHVICT